MPPCMSFLIMPYVRAMVSKHDLKILVLWAEKIRKQ